jgi:hypothetical protein
MATAAIIPIETIVNDYMLGYKKSNEDYYTYLLHACYCVRDFKIYDSDEVVTTKVTFTTNKWLTMPADMLTFVDLCVPVAGEWWSFSERRTIVNTTTFTGLVEGQDSAVGEGVDLTVPMLSGYGASGGVNDYNYTIDWEQRRIYIDGITSGTGVLMYTTSGVEITGTTYVPEIITPLIHDYLLMKETYWIPELVRERPMREKSFKETRLSLRNLLYGLTFSQWKDLILGTSSQSPHR